MVHVWNGQCLTLRRVYHMEESHIFPSTGNCAETDLLMGIFSQSGMRNST